MRSNLEEAVCLRVAAQSSAQSSQAPGVRRGDMADAGTSGLPLADGVRRGNMADADAPGQRAVMRAPSPAPHEQCTVVRHQALETYNAALRHDVQQLT